MSSLSNYERGYSAPDYPRLMKLWKAAEAAERPDIAEAFGEAFDRKADWTLPGGEPDWYQETTFKALACCLEDPTSADIRLALVSGFCVAVAKYGHVIDDPELGGRYYQESIRRGYLPGITPGSEAPPPSAAPTPLLLPSGS
jgi:hypothetical protein